MQTTEDLIRNVVQQVLTQMGTGPAPVNGDGNGAVKAPSGGDLGVFPTVEGAATAAEAAFKIFRERPLEDREKAIDVIRRICVGQADELGRLELEETKIGRLDHKIAKLRVSIPAIPGVEYLRTDLASGDQGATFTDYTAFGVIGSITPVTHSLPTLAANAINMLAAGNTVVFNAHPSGRAIAALGVKKFNKGIAEATGLENLLTIIDPPTIESANALFSSPKVRLLVVTGGPAVARAALASKRRAIVAGPGNPPVVVDPTACLDLAAKSIVEGAAFDNNLLCIGEKQVFGVAPIFDKLMETMPKYQAFRLTAPQIDSLTGAAFEIGSDGKPHVRKELVGKDPAILAAHAGVKIPASTQILYGETGFDHPFVQEEQMMPFIPFVKAPDVDRALAMARESEHGYGHTAVLHSRDVAVMTRMAKLMDCTIFVVNGSSLAGLGGAAAPSFSIAGPTGEGVTTPMTFTRQRRTAVAGGFRFA
jgi:aldehyde dehydrogenase